MAASFKQMPRQPMKRAICNTSPVTACRLILKILIRKASMLCDREAAPLHQVHQDEYFDAKLMDTPPTDIGPLTHGLFCLVVQEMTRMTRAFGQAAVRPSLAFSLNRVPSSFENCWFLLRPVLSKHQKALLWSRLLTSWALHMGCAEAGWADVDLSGCVSDGYRLLLNDDTTKPPNCFS